MATFGERLKFLRDQKGVTQEDLAKKMGYTDRSMIAKIESGKVDLSQSKIIEFAKIFNIDPGDLMGWDEPESFDTPEDFEKAWNDSGGGQHPIKLTDEEYSNKSEKTAQPCMFLGIFTQKHTQKVKK